MITTETQFSMSSMVALAVACSIRDLYAEIRNIMLTYQTQQGL